MSLQPLARAKQNLKMRLQTILDRSQAPAANFTAGQIHLGSYNLRSAGESLEELAAAGAQVFVSHAHEGEVVLGCWSGHFVLAMDLVACTTAANDERDWLDDQLCDLLTACDPANWGGASTEGPPPEKIRWSTEIIDRAAGVVRVTLQLAFPWTA